MPTCWLLGELLQQLRLEAEQHDVDFDAFSATLYANAGGLEAPHLLWLNWETHGLAGSRLHHAGLRASQNHHRLRQAQQLEMEIIKVYMHVL